MLGMMFGGTVGVVAMCLFQVSGSESRKEDAKNSEHSKEDNN